MVTVDGDAELPNGGERRQHYTEPRRNRKKLTFGYDEVVGEAGGDSEVNW
jgi:hypothetical protein